MKYVLAGSSGFLGKALARDLLADGHQVTRLVRREPSQPSEVRWDPARGQLDPAALANADVLINLAGANIGRPWTPTYRKTIRESRVSTTATLASAAAQLDRPPVFITQSGIGGYGKDCGDEILTEQSELGEGFLADVVRVWEGAADPAREAGCRVIALRTGVVLDRSAPAFQLLSLPFRVGVGGRLGPGTQYFPVVSLTDWLRAVRHCAENNEVAGPVNVTLPTPITNQDFTKALGAAMHRPTLIPVPSFVLTTLLGEFAWELIGSKRALPNTLLSTTFTFTHPTAQPALTSALA
ncbi:TIGR01777 family oxidoreductase [Streptomyces sp. SID13031]|uniref:TIGR01777 family oxidoreductase n=1 Tax=Streptomyces sp. SID13031 TaxID=2706046 RepID=UPI0013C5B397|nr:TIGR01777 family oxidoreductase [Streptomyces sp. SID13031]NEA33628.1 TIGR01777 family protein [Streptomyces sp. SID13031]